MVKWTCLSESISKKITKFEVSKENHKWYLFILIYKDKQSMLTKEI